MTPHHEILEAALAQITAGFVGTNREGVGVEPDLAVAAGDALKAALEHLRTRIG
ncbi:hypothetical protein [Streptomyces palmae]|uniref:hypothetical protein n=1 Tax=Streptomyces palmae TaxID=1701085 RepID=UPI001ADEE582|nr:hypothetical protein [Streptomyces palmae]